MNKNDIKLEVLKAALGGSLALDTEQLDKYCEWLQEPSNSDAQSHIIAKPVVQKRTPRIAARQPKVSETLSVIPQASYDSSVEDTLVRSGDFVQRMQNLVSQRIVTKCLATFDYMNITNIRDLRTTSKISMMNVKNIGKQTISAIEKTLTTYGIDW